MGVHGWCYHVYNVLREQGASHEQAAEYLHQHSKNSRPLTTGDIPKFHTPSDSTTGLSFRPRTVKPTFKPSRLEALARRMDGFETADLAGRSPIRPDNRTPASFLHSLYQPGEHVLCFSEFVSQGQTLWTRPPQGEPYNARQLDSFTKPTQGKGAWFLCNPVDGQWRNLDRLKGDTNPTGRTRRAEENITAFRYLVIESDKADPALWLAALVQIPLPIVAVYSSGGKSIHSLVKVDADTADHWRELKTKLAPALVTLGADDGAMTVVRLTRLPQCHRAEKDRWQSLYYLNPGADDTPICELPTYPKSPTDPITPAFDCDDFSQPL
jgi:hypothetical protein